MNVYNEQKILNPNVPKVFGSTDIANDDKIRMMKASAAWAILTKKRNLGCWTIC